MERTLQEKTGLQASLSTIGLIKTSVSAVGFNVRRRASNLMLTPERIFVVQINDKVKAYRLVSFTDQTNVETWISTPISNPRFKRTRNIFSTTMLMASLTVSFK